jgi:gamma-glutamylcyclotransferase (GGCT)/AIG2-like uncharacterized protein YtfP
MIYREANQDENRVLFTYGSLMSRTIMECRCRRPVFIGTATTPDHRFWITIDGVATILKVSGSTVYGVLWAVYPDDEAELDAYEGVPQKFYTKQRTEVVRRDGQMQSAIVYIATERRKGRPRVGYLETIISAAREFGFPDRYVEELTAWKAEPRYRRE